MGKSIFDANILDDERDTFWSRPRRESEVVCLNFLYIACCSKYDVVVGFHKSIRRDDPHAFFINHTQPERNFPFFKS